MDRRLFSVLAAATLSASVAAVNLPEENAFVLASYDVSGKGPFAPEHPRHWAKRMPRVADLVKRQRFDIVATQGFEAADQLAAFAASLPDFSSAGKAAPVFFRKNQFKPIAWGELPAPCVGSWVELTDGKTKLSFRLFNVRLDAASAESRLAAAEQLVERVRQAKAEGETVILTGDFNTSLERLSEEDRKAVRAAAGPVLPTDDDPETNPVTLARSVLQDSQEIARKRHYGPDETFHGWTGRPLCRLDYVFVTPNVRVLTHRTVTDDIWDDTEDLEPPSDHYPLMLEAYLFDPNTR